jgi:hypothetical protein
MAQQLQTTGTNISFLLVLFFLSYVMSSAPKYVRDVKDTYPVKPKTEKQSIFSVMKQTAGYYSIEPYEKAVKIMKNAFLPNQSLAQ